MSVCLQVRSNLEILGVRNSGFRRLIPLHIHHHISPRSLLPPRSVRRRRRPRCGGGIGTGSAVPAALLQQVLHCLVFRPPLLCRDIRQERSAPATAAPGEVDLYAVCTERPVKWVLDVFKVGEYRDTKRYRQLNASLSWVVGALGTSDSGRQGARR